MGDSGVLNIYVYVLTKYVWGILIVMVREIDKEGRGEFSQMT